MPNASAISAARWLVGVMGAVVLSFLISTVTAQHLEDTIAGRATDIIENAMPSVQMLSGARGELHQLERDLERIAAGDAAAAELHEQIAAARSDIDRALASYSALPFFPHERELFAPVTAGLAVLDRQLAADPSAIAVLRRDIATIDQAMQRVIEFDASQGERLGLEIERIRGETKGIVALLDGASVVLALCAVALALRQLRRATRARERERLERLRREEELAAQNTALGEFAGRVAHDVLSPLATTMLTFDVLRPPLEENRAAVHALDRGVASVQRVQSLVDGLLAFARAGGQPEPGEKAELATLLPDAIDGLAGQARDREVTLRLAPVPDGAVACSAGVLTSLVTNLVANAIKYIGEAPERRIDVRVIDAGARWRVEVADTGPGISEDQQERIFEPYVQLRRGRTGIGLGLATVDRLVRAHGGARGVQSRLGEGATFWFELAKA